MSYPNELGKTRHCRRIIHDLNEVNDWAQKASDKNFCLTGHGLLLISSDDSLWRDLICEKKYYIYYFLNLFWLKKF